MQEYALLAKRHDDVHDYNAFFVEMMMKSSFERSYDLNRILYSWSFHMKFIKLTKGSFDKSQMT